ncbi:hypothetical protein QYE76_048258 [Lolium multiflorum]|uniref:Retrotransposon gag domain-containing protein n=1 Tax=Lolium multiflorum TaxID=4521 RepID=A0AAD8VBH7_LOLMU|nr:hypothetical protein QYE76_048258 [Lolium multiflorum]
MAPARPTQPSAQTNLVLTRMEELQKTMEDVLSHFTTMAVDMKGVTEEVRGLRQQVEDFGEDLDAVKLRLVQMNNHKGAVPVEIVTANKGTAHARLANKGAQLLGQPAPSTGFHTAPSSPKDGDEHPENTSAGDYVVRPRRHDFPRFSGDKPLLWVDLFLTYFNMYRVPEHNWVSSATLHLEGHAVLWFQAYKRTHRLLNWGDFMQAVVEEFGQGEFDGQMTKLLQMKQTGSVAEYRLAFEECIEVAGPYKYHTGGITRSHSGRGNGTSSATGSSTCPNTTSYRCSYSGDITSTSTHRLDTETRQ